MTKRKLTMSKATRKGITLEKGFEFYLKDIEARGLEQKTIDGYIDNFKRIQKFVEEKEKSNYLSDIDSTFITEFILYLKEKNPDIRDTSIKSMLTKTRAFFYFCMEQDYMQEFRIKLNKAKKKRKELHTEEELIKILERPKKFESYSEFRNWVITYHIMATGNRAKSIRSIKIKDVDLTRRAISIDENKNDEPYQVPISELYYPVLKEFYNLRMSQGAKPDNYLFASEREEMLTEDGFKTAMRRYFKSRGIDKTSIHLLRHTFATEWILNGGSTKKLQTVLGHKTSAMVDEYVHMLGLDLKDDYDEFTPLNNLQDKIAPKSKLKIKKPR